MSESNATDWSTRAAALLADPRAHWADTFDGDMVRELLSAALVEREDHRAYVNDAWHQGAAAERARIVEWMRSGWRTAGEYEPDLCPNCCTPWKCNYPHLDHETTHELAAAIAQGAHLAQCEDKP